MWMSMTGFGRGERHGEEISVTVEARAVNHRFLDLHTRCPGRFLSWEPRIRGIVRDSLRRGKVDLHVNVREWGKLGAGLRVNDELLRSFLVEAKRIREDHGIGGEVRLRDLLAVPDLFQTSPVGDDPAELLWPVAEGAVRDALEMLGRARSEEGQRLKRVLEESVGRLRGLAAEIRPLTAENKEQATARFRERIGALSAEAGVDPVRLHQEAADALFRSPGEAVGKRFDFLVQEIFRELNTAGNKSAHAGVSALVVAAKTELEKVREQIQNIE
jgi:uncharacterized protein (TIGR00255 family)